MNILRPFSYYTRANGTLHSRYGYRTVKMEDWKANYDEIMDYIKSGQRYYVEVSKKGSVRDKWIGYIDDVKDFPDLTENTDSVLYDIYYGKHKIKVCFGEKSHNVPINWLIETDEKTVKVVNTEDIPNKTDMLGTEIKKKHFAIYRHDKEIVLGYVCDVSQRSKAVYCCRFDGSRKKRIDRPETELIVVDNGVDLYKLFVKRKIMET